MITGTPFSTGTRPRQNAASPELVFGRGFFFCRATAESAAPNAITAARASNTSLVLAIAITTNIGTVDGRHQPCCWRLRCPGTVEDANGDLAAGAVVGDVFEGELAGGYELRERLVLALLPAVIIDQLVEQHDRAWREHAAEVVENGHGRTVEVAVDVQ